MLLNKDFYRREDVLLIAQELLGKVLVTNINGLVTSGIIVETEAYAGVNDRASHAYGGRRTNRTEVMYHDGGVAYVYLCYGIHHLFNVVTNIDGVPHAVLIRAVEPLESIDIMLERRGKEVLTPSLTAGPGSLSQSLGIKTAHSDVSLLDNKGIIYIEDRNVNINKEQIVANTRVGVAYAQDDAYLPYRFFIKGNKYVSKGKGLPIK